MNSEKKRKAYKVMAIVFSVKDVFYSFDEICDRFIKSSQLLYHRYSHLKHLASLLNKKKKREKRRKANFEHNITNVL